jgi:hypothetical protein
MSPLFPRFRPTLRLRRDIDAAPHNRGGLLPAVANGAQGDGLSGDASGSLFITPAVTDRTSGWSETGLKIDSVFFSTWGGARYLGV